MAENIDLNIRAKIIEQGAEQVIADIHRIEQAAREAGESSVAAYAGKLREDFKANSGPYSMNAIFDLEKKLGRATNVSQIAEITEGIKTARATTRLAVSSVDTLTRALPALQRLLPESAEKFQAAAEKLSSAFSRWQSDKSPQNTLNLQDARVEASSSTISDTFAAIRQLQKLQRDLLSPYGDVTAQNANEAMQLLSASARTGARSLSFVNRDVHGMDAISERLVRDKDGNLRAVTTYHELKGKDEGLTTRTGAMTWAKLGHYSEADSLMVTPLDEEGNAGQHYQLGKSELDRILVRQARAKVNRMSKEEKKQLMEVVGGRQYLEDTFGISSFDDPRLQRLLGGSEDEVTPEHIAFAQMFANKISKKVENRGSNVKYSEVSGSNQKLSELAMLDESIKSGNIEGISWKDNKYHFDDAKLASRHGLSRSEIDLLKTNLPKVNLEGGKVKGEAHPVAMRILQKDRGSTDPLEPIQGGNFRAAMGDMGEKIGSSISKAVSDSGLDTGVIDRVSDMRHGASTSVPVASQQEEPTMRRDASQVRAHAPPEQSDDEVISDMIKYGRLKSDDAFHQLDKDAQARVARGWMDAYRANPLIAEGFNGFSFRSPHMMMSPQDWEDSSYIAAQSPDSGKIHLNPRKWREENRDNLIGEIERMQERGTLPAAADALRTVISHEAFHAPRAALGISEVLGQDPTIMAEIARKYPAYAPKMALHEEIANAQIIAQQGGKLTPTQQRIMDMINFDKQNRQFIARAQLVEDAAGSANWGGQRPPRTQEEYIQRLGLNRIALEGLGITELPASTLAAIRAGSRDPNITDEEIYGHLGLNPEKLRRDAAAASGIRAARGDEEERISRPATRRPAEIESAVDKIKTSDLYAMDKEQLEDFKAEVKPTKTLNSLHSYYEAQQRGAKRLKEAIKKEETRLGDIGDELASLAQEEKDIYEKMSSGKLDDEGQKDASSRLSEIQSKAKALTTEATKIKVKTENYYDKLETVLEEEQKAANDFVVTQDKISAQLPEKERDYQQARAAQIVQRGEGLSAEREETAQRSDRFKSASAGVVEDGNAVVSVANKLKSGVSEMASSINQATSPLKRLSQAFQQARQTMVEFATRMAGSFRSAAAFVQSAGNAVISVMNRIEQSVLGAASAFFGLGKSSQGAMGYVNRTAQGMSAAGYSLQNAGQQIRGIAMQARQYIDMGMQQYMEYEGALAKTATFTGMSLQDTSDLSFAIQRGQYSKSATGENQPLDTFSAKDISEALYYLSSSGVSVTGGNQAAAGSLITTILRAAGISGTGSEQMIKTVLNTTQMFGGDIQSSGGLQMAESVTKLITYMAQISALEIPDIQQTLKMVGPMANILAGGNVGQGLMDVATMTVLASYGGLRGSQVGRGLSQIYTSLIDPSKSSIDKYAASTGYVGNDAAGYFRNSFFEADGTLKGGAMGFIDTIKGQAKTEQEFVKLLAELLPTNAARTATAVGAGVYNLEKQGKYDEFKAAMGSGNSEKANQLLEDATLNTERTIAAAYQRIKNAWFEVQARIIESVKGPLIDAFHQFADVLWKIADSVRNNPWIGKLVSGLAALATIGGTVVGSFLSITGTLILLQAGLVRTGGAVGLFGKAIVGILTSVGVAIPAMLLLGATAVLLAQGWQKYGDVISAKVKDIRENFMTYFSTTLRSAAQWGLNVSNAMAEVIKFFATGKPDLENFYALMIKVFGPNVASSISAAVLMIGDKLGGLREDIKNTFDFIKNNFSSMDKFRAMLKDLFNVDDNEAITLFDKIGAFLRGFGEGFAGGIFVAIKGIIEGIKSFVNSVSDALVSLGLIDASTGRITDSFQRMGQIIGAVLGVMVVGRLITAVPLFDKLALLAVKLSFGFAKLAVQAAFTAVRIALLSAAMIFQAIAGLAAMGPLGLILIALVAVAAAAVLYTAKTEGLGAALQKAKDFAMGFYEGIKFVVEWLLKIAVVVGKVLEAIAGLIAKLTGAGSAMEVLGKAAAALVTALAFKQLGLGMSVIEKMGGLFKTLAKQIALATAKLMAYAAVKISGKYAGLGDGLMKGAAGLEKLAGGGAGGGSGLGMLSNVGALVGGSATLGAAVGAAAAVAAVVAPMVIASYVTGNYNKATDMQAGPGNVGKPFLTGAKIWDKFDNFWDGSNDGINWSGFEDSDKLVENFGKNFFMPSESVMNVLEQTRTRQESVLAGVNVSLAQLSTQMASDYAEVADKAYGNFSYLFEQGGSYGAPATDLWAGGVSDYAVSQQNRSAKDYFTEVGSDAYTKAEQALLAASELGLISEDLYTSFQDGTLSVKEFSDAIKKANAAVGELVDLPGSRESTVKKMSALGVLPTNQQDLIESVGGEAIFNAIQSGENGIQIGNNGEINWATQENYDAIDAWISAQASNLGISTEQYTQLKLEQNKDSFIYDPLSQTYMTPEDFNKYYASREAENIKTPGYIRDASGQIVVDPNADPSVTNPDAAPKTSWISQLREWGSGWFGDILKSTGLEGITDAIQVSADGIKVDKEWLNSTFSGKLPDVIDKYITDTEKAAKAQENYGDLFTKFQEQVNLGKYDFNTDGLTKFLRSLGYSASEMGPIVQAFQLLNGGLQNSAAAAQDFADQIKAYTDQLAQHEFTLADMINAFFPVYNSSKDAAAASGKSPNLFGFVAQNEDQINQSLPTVAGIPTNASELLVDMASKGFNITDLSSLGGKNVWDELMKNEGFTQFMTARGIDPKTWLESSGISQYTATAEGTAMAQGEFLGGITGATDVFGGKTFDEMFGAGQLGKIDDKLNTDWNLFYQFAASQEPDAQWSLVDFYMQQWDMTREEVYARLREQGVNPQAVEAIGNNMFPVTADSLGGQLKILDESLVEQIDQWKKNSGVENVVKMTRAEFDALSEQQKLQIAGLGLTFVISDDEKSQITKSWEELGKLLEDQFDNFQNQFAGFNDWWKENSANFGGNEIAGIQAFLETQTTATSDQIQAIMQTLAQLEDIYDIQDITFTVDGELDFNYVNGNEVFHAHIDSSGNMTSEKIADIVDGQIVYTSSSSSNSGTPSTFDQTKSQFGTITPQQQVAIEDGTPIYSGGSGNFDWEAWGNYLREHQIINTPQESIDSLGTNTEGGVFGGLSGKEMEALLSGVPIDQIPQYLKDQDSITATDANTDATAANTAALLSWNPEFTGGKGVDANAPSSDRESGGTSGNGEPANTETGFNFGGSSVTDTGGSSITGSGETGGRGSTGGTNATEIIADPTTGAIPVFIAGGSVGGFDDTSGGESLGTQGFGPLFSAASDIIMGVLGNSGLLGLGGGADTYEPLGPQSTEPMSPTEEESTNIQTRYTVMGNSADIYGGKVNKIFNDTSPKVDDLGLKYDNLSIKFQQAGSSASQFSGPVIGEINRVGGTVDGLLSRFEQLDSLSASPTVTLDTSSAYASIIGLINYLNNLGFSRVTSGVKATVGFTQVTAASGGLLKFASGGLDQEGGMALVGELGPELAHFPTNTRIYTASDTQRMLNEMAMNAAQPSPVMEPVVIPQELNSPTPSASASDVDSAPITVNFHGDMNIRSDHDIKLLVDEIDRELGRKQRRALRGMIPAERTPNL